MLTNDDEQPPYLDLTGGGIVALALIIASIFIWPAAFLVAAGVFAGLGATMSVIGAIDRHTAAIKRQTEVISHHGFPPQSPS